MLKPLTLHLSPDIEAVAREGVSRAFVQSCCSMQLACLPVQRISEPTSHGCGLGVSYKGRVFELEYGASYMYDSWENGSQCYVL